MEGPAFGCILRVLSICLLQEVDSLEYIGLAVCLSKPLLVCCSLLYGLVSLVAVMLGGLWSSSSLLLVEGWFRVLRSMFLFV